MATGGSKSLGRLPPQPQGADISEQVHKGREEVPIILSTPSPAGPAGALAKDTNSPDVGVGQVTPAAGVRQVPGAEGALGIAARLPGVAGAGGILVPRLSGAEAGGWSRLSHGGKGTRTQFGHDAARDAPWGTKTDGLGVPRGAGCHQAQGTMVTLDPKASLDVPGFSEDGRDSTMAPEACLFRVTWGVGSRIRSRAVHQVG